MSTIEIHEVFLSYGRTIQIARKSTARRAPRRKPSSKAPSRSTKGKDALSSRETEQTAGKSIKKPAHCPKSSLRSSSGSTKQKAPGLPPRRQLLSKSKSGNTKNKENFSDQRSAQTGRRLVCKLVSQQLLLLYKSLNGGTVP